MTATLPTPTSPRHLEQMSRALPAPQRMFRLPVDPPWRPVAFYPARCEEAGEVTVYVSRLPAMFYRIDCPKLGVSLATGSGGHFLADTIAAALANGMLGAGEEPSGRDDHGVVPAVGMRAVHEPPLPAQLPRPGEGR